MTTTSISAPGGTIEPGEMINNTIVFGSQFSLSAKFHLGGNIIREVIPKLVTFWITAALEVSDS